MKYWHKILLVVLILFIVALDISVMALMQKSWQLNWNRENERASSEQALIANNIFENLKSISARGAVLNNNVYHDVVKSYGDYYRNQDIKLQLWEADKLIFPLTENNIPTLSTITAKRIALDGKEYIQFAKNLPSPHNKLLLVYRRNIDSLLAMQKSLNTFFVFINLSVGLCLILVLYLILKQLTRPLSLLSEITKQIADGHYTKRANLKSKDEIGDLAYNFNKMAGAVEEHVTSLSLMADEKQRMVDNLAHELRTPLTSMQGFADYLISANSSEEDRLLAGNYIKSETLRLNQLAFKLLDISTIKHHSIQLKSVPIKALFKSVEQIEAHNLKISRLTLLTDSSIENVWGDFDLLISFLINCIENAIHASQEHSQITLSAYEKEGCGVIEVSDNGCGMDKHQSEKVFEAFYRVDKSRSREHGGAGLGLSLCKQIAEVHEAKLNLYSEIGKGTKIQIFLQLHNNFSDTP